MRDYVFTSEHFDGQILFSYDNEGVLVYFENKAYLTDVQLRYLSENFPFSVNDLGKIKGQKGVITEITDLSFDKFWNAYNKKLGNKAKAEKLWNQLSESERIEVLEALPRYDYYLQTHPGIEKAYPTTFLNQRRWENEFK